LRNRKLLFAIEIVNLFEKNKTYYDVAIVRAIIIIILIDYCIIFIFFTW